MYRESDWFYSDSAIVRYIHGSRLALCACRKPVKNPGEESKRWIPGGEAHICQCGGVFAVSLDRAKKPLEQSV